MRQPKETDSDIINDDIAEQKRCEERPTTQTTAQESLSRMAVEYSTVFNGTQDAMFLIDVCDDGNFRYCRSNTAHKLSLGITKDGVKGKTLAEILGEDSAESVIPDYFKCIQEASPVSHEIIIYIKGEPRIWYTTLSPIVLNGAVRQIVGCSRDITEIKKTEEALTREKELFKVTVKSIGEAVITTDISGRVTIINKTAEKLTGWKMEDVLGMEFGNAFHLLDYKTHEVMGSCIKKFMTDSQAAGCNTRALLIPRNSHERVIYITGSPIRGNDGKVLGSVVVFRDITEEEKRREEIRYLSFHDKLTGLYNRAFLDEELKRLDTERQLPLSIIMGDVNGLKLTNDVFGHLSGDKLLKKVAGILKKSCRSEDIIARWGGDEFSVMLPCTDYESALKICERIRELCRMSGQSPIQPSIALGCASKTVMSQKISDIAKEAEDRMYRRKLLENRSTRSSIITSLEKTLFERSFETEEHAQRLVCDAIDLSQTLKLSENQVDELKLLCILHDIGKIAIPDYILKKNSALTQEEWDNMKKHSEIGYRIALSSPGLAHIAEYILAHHERWDGTGYPQGLKGKEIPYLSRILAVLDAYDVMTHTRPYKIILNDKEAAEELKRCSGTQFDPDIVNAFMELTVS